jgi:hypothetical protein
MELQETHRRLASAARRHCSFDYSLGIRAETLYLLVPSYAGRNATSHSLSRPGQFFFTGLLGVRPKAGRPWNDHFRLHDEVRTLHTVTSILHPEEPGDQCGDAGAALSSRRPTVELVLADRLFSQ